jgi:hypothetical protein
MLSPFNQEGVVKVSLRHPLSGHELAGQNHAQFCVLDFGSAAQRKSRLSQATLRNDSDCLIRSGECDAGCNAVECRASLPRERYLLTHYVTEARLAS